MVRIAPSRMAHCADEKGATAPAVAAILVFILGFTGLAVDTGAWYMSRRELQGAADAAALAAAPYAWDAAEANTRARAILTRNGVDPASLQSMTAGVWCPSASLATASRYREGRLDCPNLPNAQRFTAVHLTLQDEGPLILSPLLAAGIAAPVFNVQATATRVNMAGLTAGSGVLDINQAAGINAVLGALLGTSVNLSAVSYQQMLAAQVDALSLLDALAVRLNLQGGSYNQVLNAQATVAQVLDVAVSVLEQQGQTGSISTGLAGAKVLRDLALQAPRQSLRVGQLVDVGVWRDLPVGQSSPTALTAGVDLLQLASAGLQLANGSNGLALAAPIDLGIVKVGLESTLIEPPQRAYFSFGPEGTSVHTAQARVLLNTQINLLGVTGDLPLYVEAGSGDAQITSITCQGNPKVDARVDVAATAGIASVHVGRPNNLNLMRNFSQPVANAAIDPANLDVRLGPVSLVRVELGAHLSPSPATSSRVFTQPTADILSMPAPAVAGFIGRPSNSLDRGSLATPARVGAPFSLNFNSLSTKVCVVVCVPGLTPVVEAVLKPVLNSVFDLLNPLISGILTGLGIHLGYVDVTVPGVRCGQAVLVE